MAAPGANIYSTVPDNIEMGILEGMQTLDQALADLVRNGIVSQEEAMMKSSSPVKLNELLQPARYDMLLSTDSGKEDLDVENTRS